MNNSLESLKNQMQESVLRAIPRPGTCHGRYRVLLPPRFGKTKLAIDLIKRDAPPSVLWVTPSLKLAKDDIPFEFRKWGAGESLANLSTSTWASLNKRTGEFGLIVLDEDHFATENNLKTLLNGELRGGVVSMTGTPSKHKAKKELYGRLGLEVMHEVSLNQAVALGILSNYSVNVLKVPISSRSEASNYAYHDNRAKESVKMHGFKSEAARFAILGRMRAVKSSPSKLAVARRLIGDLKGRKLLFCGTIEQSKALCPHVFNSKSNGDCLDAFQNGEIDTLALVNSGGTGFTYKGLDHLVLVQADSDKNGNTTQKIARALQYQTGYKAKIWLLSLQGTKDVDWVSSTLKNFDSKKTKYFGIK